MLTFLIRNDHSEFAILLHNVDALDVNLLKLLLFVLNSKSRQEKHDAAERCDMGVDL